MVAPVVDWRGRTNKHSGVSGIATQLLVLHSAESPLRGGYAQSLSQWCIDNPGIISSWQRFVDPIARVRLIDDQYAAWHASYANPMSIGWEQAGYARFTRDEWTTPEGMKQLDNLAFDMAEVALAEGIPLVWLTTEQVEAIVYGGNRTLRGFCIHAQVDPATRYDPGTAYPYDLLTEKIGQYMGVPSMALPQAPEELIIEEIDMTAEQNILARLEQIVGWQDQRFNDLAAQEESNRNMLAGFVRDVVNHRGDLTDEQIDQKFQELTQSATSPQQLFKGDADPTVYAWGDGKFRALTFEEYLQLISAGAVLQVLPQPVIDATVKAA